MDETKRLVDFLCSVRYEDLPQRVVDAAKKSILDTLAVIIGGSCRDGCNEILQIVEEWGSNEEATIGG